MLKEVVEYPAKETKVKVLDENGNEEEKISKKYLTHTIRCKGASIVGKPRSSKVLFPVNSIPEFVAYLLMQYNQEKYSA
mgnify:CR=1 FL=1